MNIIQHPCGGDNMQDLTLESGRIKINMKAITLGEDLCIIIAGGDSPHIGCVTLSVPRPSLSDVTVNSATTSVLNLVGHKDDEAARYVSHALSSRLNKNVVVTCGIHVDNITPEEIKVIMNLLKELTDTFIQRYI
jgi:gallate decarboxylase subunit D